MVWLRKYRPGIYGNVEVYSPAKFGERELDACLVVHGGGGTKGAISLVRRLAMKIAVDLDCIAIAPDYDIFPSGIADWRREIDDLYTCLAWYRNWSHTVNIRATDTVFGIGGSWGGGLVAAMCAVGRLDGGVSLSGAVDATIPIPRAGPYGHPRMWPDVPRLVTDAAGPLMLVNAESEFVPEQGAMNVYNAYQERGIESVLHIVPGTKHAQLNLPAIVDGKTVYEHMVEWLRSLR